ncbi:MAG: DUF192 domain-containing protein [Acidobacteriota bacterium]|nr:DUF192 domain-containing protein [Acidobacteriota bacterium]MDQ7088918.1 DUF192 domain-containing protein [Acidobacteriota bacterium]
MSTEAAAFGLALMVALAAGCGPTASPSRAAAPAWVRVATPSGAVLVLEVRQTPAERAQGMMGREEVPPGGGMYFVFERQGRHPFWMKNCKIPLDIVWLSADHRVVHVERALPPCGREPCPSWAPSAPARYVIEVGADQAEGYGLVPGARVLVTPFEQGTDP